MAQLPPKVPTMTHNWPSFPHQAMSNYLSNSTATTTSTAAAAENHHPQSWVEDFLDFTSAKRGVHSRSISDSITFLETTAITPILLDDPNNNNSGNNNSNGNNMTGFDKLDDEQLMSMFSDDMSLSLPPSSSNPSTPSDQNSNNDDQKPPAAAAAASDRQQYQPQLTIPEKQEEFPEAKIEPGLEVDSSCQQELQNHVATQQNPNSSSADTIFDPKRVKRILANRQSAQRSRIRKLQYISELERTVTTLQTEISALSPRVAFLDHQWLILNVDNSTLKQRIAALAQDKIFKDAHQEALKKEIERLRQVYHQQNLKKTNDNNNNNNASSLQQQQHEAPNFDPTTMPGWDKKQQVLIN